MTYKERGRYFDMINRITKRLNIYVLNWNQAEITVDCITSLIGLNSPIDYKIFIIDNGSTDNSIKVFSQTFPDIKILRNETNLGYQGGMNTGIKHAINHSVEFLMLLNNDTVVDHQVLNIIFDSLPDDASLVSPGIYFCNNREKLCALGGNYHPLFLEILGKPNDVYDPPKEVINYEFIPSHAWVVRVNVFKSIGLLDQNFFPIYYDDLDFCLRMKKHGLKLYLIPQAKIYHFGSMSVGGVNSPKERYLMARNSGYYFRKHMKFWQAPFVFFFRLASGVIWTVRLLTQRRFDSLLGYWKGYYEGWFKKMPGDKQ